MRVPHSEQRADGFEFHLEIVENALRIVAQTEGVERAFDRLRAFLALYDRVSQFVCEPVGCLDQEGEMQPSFIRLPGRVVAPDGALDGRRQSPARQREPESSACVTPSASASTSNSVRPVSPQLVRIAENSDGNEIAMSSLPIS